MPELILQTLYCSLASLAVAIAVVKIVTDHIPKLQRKPFTCVYCMTVWAAFPVCLLATNDVVTGLAMWPIAHILAYIIYQKGV